MTKLLREKTSVKDVIESCGVPHTDVHAITCNGVAVSFDHQIREAADIEVQGVLHPGVQTRAGLQETTAANFVADGHLGKLARHLRLLGLDVWYDRNASDHTLAEISRTHERALLTRDRRLLMHKIVRAGYCVRSTDPDEQIAEVFRRYDLRNRVAPYTRCMVCNGSLVRAEKSEVLEQLEPLTRIYYEEFRRCSDCAKVYWRGSHFRRLEARMKELPPNQIAKAEWA